MLTHVNFPCFAMADPPYGELMRYRNANTDRLELIFSHEASFDLFYTALYANSGISKTKGRLTYLRNFVPKLWTLKISPRDVDRSNALDGKVDGQCNKPAPLSTKPS